MPHMTRTPPVTLHLGAHRTGTRSLQRMMAAEAADLAARGIAAWGPSRLRGGLLAGILGDPGRQGGQRDVRAYRSAGRIAMLRDALEHDGITRLVLSDANMLGSTRENVLLARLYPSVRGRAERLRSALPGVDRVVVTIREQGDWWTSVFAAQIAEGYPPPDPATLEAVSRSRRRWRDVIEELADGFPQAEILVRCHDAEGSGMARLHADLAGLPPRDGPEPRLARAPSAADLRGRLADGGGPGALPLRDGRFAPFDARQRAAMAGRYEQDLDWLRHGADGLVDPQDAPDAGPIRDRGARDGTSRRQSHMGAAG